jgi:phosphotriesterase-related protein
MSQEFESKVWTRREALELLGIGAAAAAFPRLAAAQAPASSSTAAPAFPKGAVIRTILKDYAPEELAGSATLFHEHMSFADNFMTRWNGYAAETRAANAPPAGAGGRAGAAGRVGGGAAAAGGGAATTAAAGGAATTGAAGAAAPTAAGAARGGRAGGTAAPAGPFFMQDVDLMADELSIAKREGIGCIVDGGHPDMGRDINFLRQISMKSGMPIVAGGGFYTQPFYPKEISTWSEEQIVQALIKQTETDPIGVFGEIGSWDDITADERKVFRAVGKAHVATNIPIFTHTGIPGKSALEQLDLLEDAGVKPSHIVIGHLGNLVDANVQVQKAICKRGAFIGFDRQGGAGDAQQVPMVMALIEAGYADNLMFSADISGANQMKRNNGQGYAKTLTVFVPKLKAAGASDEVLRRIMQDNPRRFLAFVPKKARKA